jgi:uncharacterized protein (DUF2249 family)
MPDLSREQQLQYINDLKNKIRDHEIIQHMFQEHDVDLSEFDLIPMAFADLDVSARTDHGIIFLSYNVLDNDTEPQIDNDHYLVHEISHVLQQCTGNKPTKGSNEGDYLDNPYEQEAFQNQTAYIADEYSEDKAVEYVERVLDKHEVEGKEREEKAEVLLNIAKLRNNRIRRADLLRSKGD